MSAESFANAAQNHHGIKNRLHWVFDTPFREDDWRASLLPSLFHEAECDCPVEELTWLAFQRSLPYDAEPV